MSRPRSLGFIVIDTRTGEILSDLFKYREEAQTDIKHTIGLDGRDHPQPGDVQYRGGKWYRSLGVHQVKLYPGESYSRLTYKP